MAQVPSFNWCAVDVKASLTGPVRVYSDSIVKMAGTALPIIQPTNSYTVDISFNTRIFSIHFEKWSRYAWIATTYHEFGDTPDHIQATYLLCPGIDLDKQHELGSWEHFLGLSKYRKAAEVLRQQRVLLLTENVPVAYSLRHFEGIMADCEMVHQAVAAEYFATTCQHASLPDAEWVGPIDS